MDIIGIIPARSGSKGVPRKNVKELAGQPLILYSIKAAQKSAYIDDIIVTTDDDEIAELCNKEGVEIINRPGELAKDESLVMEAIRHVLSEKKKSGCIYDLIVLLEPTSPFRKIEDIDGTIKLLIDKQADSAATFSETDPPPTRIWRIENESPVPFIEGADPFLPRQQQAKGYVLNGMVYVLKTAMLQQYPKSNSFLLGKSVAYIIPGTRVVDIDTKKNFYFAEYLIKMNHISIK